MQQQGDNEKGDEHARGCQRHRARSGQSRDTGEHHECQRSREHNMAGATGLAIFCGWRTGLGLDEPGVAIGNRAILGPAAARHPAAGWHAGLERCVVRRAIDACLPA